MKKIIKVAIVSLSLLSAQLLSAENSQSSESSEMYVGLNIEGSSNSFSANRSSGNWDDNPHSNGLKLKLGTLSNDGWRVQGYFLYERYDKSLFDDSHDVLHELGVDVIKGFETTPEFSPFIQAGLGYGWMNVNGHTDNSISELSLKFGGGVMYKVAPEFELLAGLDLQFRKWEDIESSTYTLSVKENSTRLYIGANYHF